jgi:hypothetical protein
MPFQPPDASSRQLAGVPFDSAVDFAAAAKARYDAFDRRPSNSDPSKCKALLAFPVNGSGSDIRAVFWSAKMSIDADGPSAGPRQKRGKDLDPTGQNVTTFRFSGGGSLPAEAVPYIVLPLNEDKDGPFDPNAQHRRRRHRDLQGHDHCRDLRRSRTGQEDRRSFDPGSRGIAASLPGSLQTRRERLLFQGSQCERGRRRTIFRVSEFRLCQW